MKLSLFVLGCAIALLAGCGGMSSVPVPAAPNSAFAVFDAPSKTTTIPLKAAGGSISIPLFDGLRGILPYASNDAGKGVTLALTNDGATRPSGAPTPPASKPILFLSARIDGKVSVAFKSTTAKALIRATALVNGDTYTLYLYRGKKELSKVSAGSSSDHALRFTTPLSAISVAPSTPLVMELAATLSPLTVKPESLKFSTGASQTFKVLEAGYTGKLTATSSNTNIATVSPSSVTGPSGFVGVTPLNGGTCTITLKDANGRIATVAVSVNGGSIVVNTKSLE